MMSARGMLSGLRAFPRSQSHAAFARRLSSKLVLGCGSNVVDHIYNVKVVPRAGEKGFFLSPFKAIDKKLIGGVTLNHLSWAALGGVNTGLLALQGEDELGHFIRTNLKKLQVETSFIKVDSGFSTSQCHVFIQEDGERSIIMAPASTSLIDTQAVQDHFDPYIQTEASMVTTEVSQVPLSGVLALLKAAKRANVLSVLDLDVPPKVAIEEACLGSLDELVECVRLADVLKPAHAAAQELLTVMTGKTLHQSSPLRDLTKELIETCGSKLLAITNGSEGSIIANTSDVVEVEAPRVSKVLDTTGAGDAFLGGLIVGLKASGMPQSSEDLRKIGIVANAYGAACTQSVGGVPVDTSYDTIQRFLPGDLAMAPSSPSQTSELPITEFISSISKDEEGVRGIASGLDKVAVKEFLTVLEQCDGQILLSGLGKSGQVANRFSSSLTSVGISSQYVHASEWAHGDLGKAVAGRDVVVFLSHSGNTEECVRAAQILQERGVAILAVTGNKEAVLEQLCLSSLVYPHDLKEPFGCVPTTSLVIQNVVLNGVLCELVQRKGISKKTFQRNHPGGTIGRNMNS